MSKKFPNTERRRALPGARYPNFLNNLNTIYLFYGTDDKAAKALGVDFRRFAEWRKGEHVPPGPTRKYLASRLGVSEPELLHEELGERITHNVRGAVPEPLPDRFATRERAQLARDVAEIALRGPDALVKALRAVIDLAKDLGLLRLFIFSQPAADLLSFATAHTCCLLACFINRLL